HIFHRKEVMAILLEDVVDADDVWVFEPRKGYGFVAKTLDCRGAGDRAGEDRFHGDDAIEADLPRAIDHAHSAAPDFFEQFVVANALTDQRTGGREAGP